MIEAIFGVFGLIALLTFRFVAPATAVATICLAGWLLLPVGNYPPGSAAATFPYWITGTAVPSDMLLTKMWWPPAVALLGAILTDRKTLAQFRVSWTDVPIAMWCLWPIVQWPFVESPEPPPWIASLYLVGAWGTPWYLGRLYFWGSHGGKVLIQALEAGLVVITPVALVESFLGPKVYGWFYDTHPFRNDGVERYLGFRPLGFFENGNQYGIWAAVTAFAAIWLWQSAPASKTRNLLAVLAALGVVIALASQSVGAIALLCVGLALCWGVGRFSMRGVLVLSLLLALTAGAVYLSGAIPLRSIAENTAIGRYVVNIVRSSGRGSFTWRLARDQTALRLIDENPIVGAARWDWWRENGERPWSLAFLIVGQFGVVGLVLAFGSLLIPVFLSFVGHAWPAALLTQPERALGAIVLIATVDALLNSFFFYPAILAAGALGTTRPSRKIESFVRGFQVAGTK